MKEILAYCKQYENSIPVRAKVNDKWGSYFLSELSPDQWAENVYRWIKDGYEPARLVDE